MPKPRLPNAALRMETTFTRGEVSCTARSMGQRQLTGMARWLEMGTSILVLCCAVAGEEERLPHRNCRVALDEKGLTDLCVTDEPF